MRKLFGRSIDDDSFYGRLNIPPSTGDWPSNKMYLSCYGMSLEGNHDMTVAVTGKVTFYVKLMNYRQNDQPY